MANDRRITIAISYQGERLPLTRRKSLSFERYGENEVVTLRTKIAILFLKESMAEDETDLASILKRVDQGGPEAESLLTPALYQELRRLARSHLRRERPGHTLQTTALVHEAYLRLVDQRQIAANKAQYFALASRVMRRILVDYARKRNREKRGGGEVTEELTETSAMSKERSKEILQLDEALKKLAELEPRQVRVVELRYFVGLTIDEVADLLEVSPKTVKRDWNVARAWLFQTLSAES